MAVGLHVQFTYTRTRATGVEDVAVTTHDFWHPSASDFPTALMTSLRDYYVEGFWDPISSYIGTACTLASMRCYDDYNGDGSPGSVDQVYNLTEPGTSSAAMLPPQVACSVTELLGPDSRPHWGRFYLPGIAANALASDGSWSSAFVTAVANAAETLYDAWTSSEAYPIVWVAGTPGFNPVQVAQIRVDNIPDIQRRRRYQTVTQRETRTVD